MVASYGKDTHNQVTSVRSPPHIGHPHGTKDLHRIMITHIHFQPLFHTISVMRGYHHPGSFGYKLCLGTVLV